MPPLRLRLADRPKYHTLFHFFLSHPRLVYFIILPLLTPIFHAQSSFTHGFILNYFLYLLFCSESLIREFSRLRGFRSLLFVGFWDFRSWAHAFEFQRTTGTSGVIVVWHRTVRYRKALRWEGETGIWRRDTYSTQARLKRLFAKCCMQPAKNSQHFNWTSTTDDLKQWRRGSQNKDCFMRCQYVIFKIITSVRAIPGLIMRAVHFSSGFYDETFQIQHLTKKHTSRFRCTKASRDRRRHLIG